MDDPQHEAERAARKAELHALRDAARERARKKKERGEKPRQPKTWGSGFGGVRQRPT